MLGQKFPGNWSYGHLYEFLKENWSKKRKRANSYPFDHDKPMNYINNKVNNCSTNINKFDLSCLPKNPI